MVTSQPLPYLNGTETYSILPSAPLYENTTQTSASPSPSPLANSGRGQRRAGGKHNARYHPASVPQQLSRGMRKTWGPAAAIMSLESTIEELRRESVDDDAIGAVKDIFSADFSVDALMRKMTKEESRVYLNGERGQAYRALLRVVNERFQCRLCRESANAMSWKHPRDVVRHLRRDHFGLGDACQNWFVTSNPGLYPSDLTSTNSNHVVYTTGEMTNHRCKAQ
jgi:hypothetical protein